MIEKEEELLVIGFCCQNMMKTLIHDLCFSYETWFFLLVEVNSQKNRYWSKKKNPRLIRELPLHYETVGVRCDKYTPIIVSIFYDDAVDAPTCVNSNLRPFSLFPTELKATSSGIQSHVTRLAALR
jgi:hypothetical protein